MDISRNIRNDTFGYGGITAKRSKYQERLQSIICSFTDCRYPGDGEVLGSLHDGLSRQHLGHDTWGEGGGD